VQLHQSIFLSHSLMFLNLSTSSFSSTTRLSRSFTWSHQTRLLSLLFYGTSARLRHSLQPEIWTAVCLSGTSVWVLTLLLATAFPRVETTARMSPERATSTSQIARRGTAPCLHAFPTHPACANCCANHCATPWLTCCTPFDGPIRLCSWWLTLPGGCSCT